MTSAKSSDSIASTGDARSMVTALSGSDEERASTPIEQFDVRISIYL
jgi:hypothetical protein